MVSTLSLSVAAAGLLGTAFSLPRSLMALPAGLLVQRLGPGPMMHGGVALVAMGTLIPMGASSLGEMAVARACSGLGYGAFSLVGMTYLMRAGPGHQRTRRPGSR